MISRLKTTLCVVLLFAAAAPAQEDSESLKVKGRVVDAKGAPVSGVEVAGSWSLEDGKLVAVGGATTGHDGTFAFDAPPYAPQVMTLAYNRDRAMGGLAMFDQGAKSDVEIKLEPLGRLALELDTSKLGAANDSSYLNISAGSANGPPVISCMASGKLTIALPAGSYQVMAMNLASQPPTSEEVKIVARQTAEHRVAFEPSKLTKLAGKAPPPWYATDARGVGADVTLADFKGKWLLLEFWGYW